MPKWWVVSLSFDSCIFVTVSLDDTPGKHDTAQSDLGISDDVNRLSLQQEELQLTLNKTCYDVIFSCSGVEFLRAHFRMIF